MKPFDKALEIYKGLPSWGKGLVVVGGAGAVIVLGVTIYKKIFPEKPSQELLNVEDDLIRLSKIHSPTYADSAYDGYANTVYNSQRTSLGNDSGRIMDTLVLMQNDLDVAKLIKAYGTRQNYAFGFPTESYNLLGAARNGITSDMYGLYSYRVGIINKDWTKKGITYQI
jgi:hypothetical protein